MINNTLLQPVTQKDDVVEVKKTPQIDTPSNEWKWGNMFSAVGTYLQIDKTRTLLAESLTLTTVKVLVYIF